MSQSQPSSGSGPRLPVLYVDAEVVEFVSTDASGVTHVASRAVEGQGSIACVVAIGQLLASLPRRPRACVVALGPTFVRHRLLTLPTLNRRESKAVLQRRAAQVAECDVADVAFTAIGFGVQDSEVKGGASEERWLVAASKRSDLRELCVELERLGLRLRRVVSAHLSAIVAGQNLRTDRAKASIVVSASRRTSSVAVLQGDALHGENVLDGDVRTQPSVAMSIVQEIKSNDAAWRKAHRGGAIEEVVLIGLPPERAPLFHTAVQAALPGAHVVLVDGRHVESAPATIDAGRLRMLEACREEGLLQLDMKPTLPWQPRKLVTSLACVAVVLGTVGLVEYKSLRRRERAEMLALQELRTRAGDLEVLRDANTRIEHKAAALEELVARNDAVLRDGWPLREMLHDVLHAFGRDAAVLNVQLGPHATEPQAEITGTTSPDPLRAMENVARIVKELEASPRFGPTVAAPGGGVPDGRQSVTFTLKTAPEARP